VGGLRPVQGADDQGGLRRVWPGESGWLENPKFAEVNNVRFCELEGSICFR
jgi:hypothetical protein